MSVVGVLSALSVVLMIFPKFPVIPAFPFLEVDFSDIPALLTSAVMSPGLGVLIVLVKNAIHLIMTSTGGVGELSNFLCGAAYVLGFGIIFRTLRLGNKYLKLAVSLLIGAVTQIIAAVLGNYFLMIPLYHIEAAAASYILGGVIPFNIVKDVLVAVVFAAVYIYIYPHLAKYVSKD